MSMTISSRYSPTVIANNSLTFAVHSISLAPDMPD